MRERISPLTGRITYQYGAKRSHAPRSGQKMRVSVESIVRPSPIVSAENASASFGTPGSPKARNDAPSASVTSP